MRNYAFFGEESMTNLDKDAWSLLVVKALAVGLPSCWPGREYRVSGNGASTHLRYLEVFQKSDLLTSIIVTLSSLNRHATAVLPEVEKKTLKQIARCVQVHSRIELWRKDEDAIDNIQTTSRPTQDFSSMGAGAKCDPTQIQIGDISDTIYDPLASFCVDSSIPVVKLLPLSEEEFQKGSVKERSACDNFHVRTSPVFGPLPSIFDEDDIALIFEDIYRGCSLPPPHDVPTRLTWVRWDPARPLYLKNYLASATTPKELWDSAVQHIVDRRAAERRWCLDW
ncbi:hypothetical protein BYT27DRAFT_7221523 [Phlegmacium glaucopus]|nr:hypothetical protein BYT27DRAFT_7221523 [Phlegmacium glaucopus]